MKTTTKIYVGTYGKYNEGSLFGQWFDLEDYSDASELMEAIADYHSEENDPEYMIQDTDTDCKFIREMISESLSEDELQDVYDAIEAINDMSCDIEVLEAYISCFGMQDNIQDTIESMEESYSGEFDSDEEFAENLADEMGLMNESKSWPFNCIDWEYAARELMYDYAEHNGHYFRNI